MPLIPLNNGTYIARSPIANYQRCVNLYPERNVADTSPPVQTTHYLTPGLTQFGESVGPGAWRPGGLYLATNGHLYGVRGGNLYDISSTGVLTLLGSLTTTVGAVSMRDNDTTMVVVDGSTSAFVVDMTTNAFGPYVDANYLGADRVDYLDTFLIFNEPETKNFYSSLSNTTTLDPLYIAGLTVTPDKLVTFMVMNRNIWFLCETDGEIWYNAGGFDFPFAILPGQIIEEGCSAALSVVRHNLKLFWLSRDVNGHCVALRGENYRVERISTFGVEWEWSRYERIDDAIGMIYQRAGHVFWVLTFPTADRTWVFDVVEGLWHEWLYHDDDGTEHRHRANCMAFAFGKTIVGDYANGKLYYLDWSSFLDDEQPIIRRRGFPHLTADGRSITIKKVIASMACGLNEDALDESLISLRFSDDGGFSWSTPMRQTLGTTGRYLERPTWFQQGMARDRVYELFWSVNADTALNGFWLDADPVNN